MDKECEQSMKRLLMIFLAMIVFAITVRAQSVLLSDTLKARFVSCTVEEYFSYWGKEYPNSLPKRTITLITDIDAGLLPDTVAGLPVKVIDDLELLRKRKNRRLIKESTYKVKVNTIAADTIDVSLIEWRISFEGWKQIGVVVIPRDYKYIGYIPEYIGYIPEYIGYIPDGRFVYDATTNNWKASFYDGLVRLMERDPEFYGGAEALFNFWRENLRYPQEAMERKIEGKVYVAFRVELDGDITNAFVLRDIGGGCGDEALRVANLMPQWKPAIRHNKPAGETYVLPIIFALPPNDPVIDTNVKGIIIKYYCDSSLTVDTIFTNHSGWTDIHCYPGAKVEYHDMQEMKIEGVEVKVKY